MAKRIEMIAACNEFPQDNYPLSVYYQSIFNHLAIKAFMLIALLTAGSSIVGCGSSDPYALVPISGTITYEDGTPIPDLKLQFVSQKPPIDSKTNPRPSSATVSEDGTLEVATTYVYGDGIITGEHKVILQSINVKRVKTKAVPQKYGVESTTPLTVNTADMPFKILIEKP